MSGFFKVYEIKLASYAFGYHVVKDLVTMCYMLWEYNGKVYSWVHV